MLSRFVRFGEFELDRESFQLLRQGAAVKMENLPLQLLMLLVAQRGQIVSRREIEENLWGKGVFVDVDQGINTAIRKIRLALEDNYVQPRYLQTVVGRGYRFVAETVAEGAVAAGSSGDGEVMFSAEELGRAIMAAAGLDPNDPDLSPKREPDS